MAEEIQQRENQEGEPLPENMIDEELGKMIEKTSRESAAVQDEMHKFTFTDYPMTVEGKRYNQLGLEGKIDSMDIEDQIKQFPELYRAMDEISKRDHELFTRYLKYQQAYGQRTGKDYFQEKYGDRIDLLFREINCIPLEKGKTAVSLAEEEARVKAKELEMLLRQYKDISGVNYDFSTLKVELFEAQHPELAGK